ncbi:MULTISPECIES: hypothetical protein [unclassified Clostridioides]|uniref:hypothetical protein n=1 Tax=unclassified Clostridioides TaxID=2635829 RepID=UPI001D0C7B0F|nr:hypothetical protein [Clostridioides sp. ES-S-0049-03]MCC0652456.1 hypothetical protein [Clostridioides sp. ES-S-0001-03]MCC0675096.1 hypothetical protein [Clostridioides sp. ES-W-0018-02]MCC0695155.1 hypothetical protein [Clostridioides sp. ES-S-0048-02]MCC0710093.1 hypothetical protein [Clostridioides sp. ES-W-0017-02]
MNKIYIVTTYTGTVLSYLIRNISKKLYTHVSISLNENLKPMYSFGRLNPRNPFIGGFVEENINQGLYAIRKNTVCRVYSLEVCNSQYENLFKNIKLISDYREDYYYDIMALIYLSMNIHRKVEYKYVCSNFVADMLEKSEIDILNKEAFEVTPNDFYNLNGLTLEYEGLLSEYNSKQHSYVSKMANI